ncbi:hypothetical protein HF313_24445 [Massilia atriviolacea]|uniref:Uncharacterized protein n=1 Tax=Massilia atriviolacea TaxID=2495579 RepID=A0A430HK09_9BURK|nr:hypothetical protein [Massilia atriviolacea]RSZ57840.1 hypothetical protein EJB06_16040 [Massilia atriviolacea]
MPEQTQFRALDTHNAMTRHYVEQAARYADLKTDAQTWTSTSATGSCAYVFVYLNVDLSMTFANGVSLSFDGKGMVVGLGATGAMGGQVVLNVDPNTLRGASGITFQASSIGVGVGGFQVTFYKDHGYIGHAEFVGAGVQLGTPGGGWGEFK